MSDTNEPVSPLPGFVPWPDNIAANYRAKGYWQGQTLGAFLQERANQFGDRLALVCGERRWTYSMLNAKVDALAAEFYRYGLRRRDRVVVQLPNIAEFFIVCFALFRVGAIPVMALPAHRRAEIEHFCTLADARAYVIADQHEGFDYRVLAREVRASCSALEQVFVVGDAQEFMPVLPLMTPAPAPVPMPGPMNRVIGDDTFVLEIRGETSQAHEVAFLQLSGGSTGLPKLIPRTHDDYLYSVRASAELCHLSEESVYLCVLPAAHNFPLSSPGTLGVLHKGGTVVMAPRPTAEVCFSLIRQERVTITALVPPLAMLWLDAARQHPPKLDTLLVLQVGGAKFSSEAAQRVTPLLGCVLQQVFGMAEGLVNYTRIEDASRLELSERIFHTQGAPLSCADEIRVVDDEDQPVPAGQPGHLQARGPYTIRGYYCAEAHNANAFTHDGFYRTGDIVRLRDDGYLVVEGRAKDQINRGGEKIAAEEVENHLLAHPQVLDAALVAMPDALLGEKSCAFIVVRGQPPRKVALQTFLRERGLAAFKMPDRIEFVEQFPRTRVGKVDKRALRAVIAARLGVVAVVN